MFQLSNCCCIHNINNTEITNTHKKIYEKQKTKQKCNYKNEEEESCYPGYFSGVATCVEERSFNSRGILPGQHLSMPSPVCNAATYIL